MLLRSVLFAIPTALLLIFKLPMEIGMRLEGMMRLFLESDLGQDKVAGCRWFLGM